MPKITIETKVISYKIKIKKQNKSLARETYSLKDSLGMGDSDGRKK